MDGAQMEEAQRGKELEAKVDQLNTELRAMREEFSAFRSVVGKLARVVGAPGEIQKALGVPPRPNIWDRRES